MLRFNGKIQSVGDGAESISDATSEGMKSQKALNAQQTAAARPKSALKG